MINRLKKFITLMLCASLLNACILPSVTIWAAKPTVSKKQQVKPSEPKVDVQEEENPTMQESWQKVINLEWKELNKADAWNIGKTVGGTLSAAIIAYALFKFKPTSGTEPQVDPIKNTPGDKPIIIIPEALKNITDGTYGPEYTQKIQAICNNNHMKQLEDKGLINLQDQLIKEIKQTDNPTEERIKELIDRHHNVLQKHLEKKTIIDSPSTENKKQEEKPKPLYSLAKQTNRQNVAVVRQAGASCGYHAMLNSILPLVDGAENQANEIINTKFAQKDSIWRARMIQSRKERLVKNYIQKLMHTCMLLNTEEEQDEWNNAKAEWNDKISGSFGWFYRIFNSHPKKPMRKLNDDQRRALSCIANAYAHAFILDENLNILQENAVDLETQLQHIIRQDRPHMPLQEVENTSRCIMQIMDLTELPIEIAHATGLIKHAVSCASGSNLETDLYGDNLNTEEMEALKAFILAEYAIDGDTITIIDNTNVLNTQAYQDILTPAKEQMHQDNCIHSFCIRTSAAGVYNEREVEQLTTIVTNANNTMNTMAEEILALQATVNSDTANADQKKQAEVTLQEKRTALEETEKTKNSAESRQSTINERLSADTGATHWICVTLDRKNGQNAYLTKDSMGCDYTNQHNVLQLIEALEQPYAPQHIEILEPQNDSAIDDSTSNNNATPQAPIIENNHNASTNNDTLNITQELKDFLDNAITNTNKEVATTDKNTTNTNAKKEIITIPLRPTTEIPTLEQTGNSCAYHALKNGDDLLDILKKPVIEVLHNDFETIITRIGSNLCCLRSTEKVTTLFNEKNNSGEWREIIRKERAIPTLKACIKEKLLQSVPLTTAQQIVWDKELKKYETDLQIWNDERIMWGEELLREYCNFHPKPNSPNKPKSSDINKLIEQDFNDIAHACAKQLVETKEPIILVEKAILQELLVNIVHNNSPTILPRENYIQCTELLNADELEKNFGNAMTEDTLLANAPNRNELIIVNNLSDEELGILIEKDKDKALENKTLKHALDISIITGMEEPAFVYDVLPSIKAKMQSPKCLHAFVMRSGFSKKINNFDDEKTQANNGTHWICIVLYRVNNENYYIIADSYKGDKFKTQLAADVKALIAMLKPAQK